MSYLLITSSPLFHLPIRGRWSGHKGGTVVSGGVTTPLPQHLGQDILSSELITPPLGYEGLYNIQTKHAGCIFIRFQVRCFNISPSHCRKPFIMGWKCLENGLLINMKWESAPQSKGDLAAVRVMSACQHFLGGVIGWGPIPGYVCFMEPIQHKSCHRGRLETEYWEPSTACWVTASQKLLKPLISIFFNH